MNFLLKTLISTALMISISNANDELYYDLKVDGVPITFETSLDDGPKEHIIKRIHDNECKFINGADPKNIWSGNYAKEEISEKCKKTFLTTPGKITPMKITDKVKTIGELEVINFIEKSQDNKNLMLIDARLPDWFFGKTIPTAENIPFTYFNPKKFPEEFLDVLDMIGVEKNGETYDFSNAKELVLFCNGAWCPQSTFAIDNLIKIGYPEEKLSWYRGGMYSWTLLNLTTTQAE